MSTAVRSCIDYLEQFLYFNVWQNSALRPFNMECFVEMAIVFICLSDLLVTCMEITFLLKLLGDRA